MTSGNGMADIDLASIKTIDGLDVAGKRVLVRADLNVPVEDGAVADATRIERVLPTIEALRKAGAKVVLMSHFGRPKGERSPETSLKPVATKLAELLGADVTFLDDCIGPDVEAGIASLKDGDVVLLENLRYHAGETKNDIGFAKQLAALGDIYVDDAFSCAHRAHASVEAIARLMPAYAGMAMMAEINALSAALENPKRPVMAVVGGAKVSTKIEVLTNLAQRMDMIVVGGGMANTFLFADGIDVGKSLCEPDFVDTVKEITEKAKASGCEIVLPVDVVVAKSLAEDVETSVCGVDEIPDDALALDQGPKSVELLIEKLEGAHTILWNGPLGAFEIAPFGAATFALATEAGARTKAGKLISVAGGGDTVRALNMAGAADNFTYISTAGGAFLEWLAGEQLPGVAVLADCATPPQSAVA
ncbi:phosphoglycerate kinase [Methyloceanibacter sp. wino2]|uniref:phosphoglycerate kinase n=1 Tax=Methyloceanibacter sp. wino2 TaxID=2170729 RepID=UPI001FE09A4B|nr:phosphoglycerate kinase [Methyloceanibacter sp. wino2]